ncbi:hypothetical protein GCM10023069_02780 [Shinella granuli]
MPETGFDACCGKSIDDPASKGGALEKWIDKEKGAAAKLHGFLREDFDGAGAESHTRRQGDLIGVLSAHIILSEDAKAAGAAFLVV